MFGLLIDLILVAIGFFGGYWLQLKMPGLHTDIINKGKNAYKTVRGWFTKK